MAEQTAATQKEPGQHEPIPHGTICWAELASKDLESSKTFYTELFGWQLKGGNTPSADCDAGAMDYTEIIVGGKPSGGMYQITEQMAGMPSNWSTYVSVDDVDASAKRVEELGGSIVMPPMDIPQVGRFCVIKDPSGATIQMITLGG
jgi:hypothetical protein